MNNIKASVHLIATTEWKNECIGRFVDTGNLIYNKKNDKDIPRGQAHYLYTTTDEEIKEGDWYIFFNADGTKEVRKDKNDAHGMCSCQKIVATNNPELWTKKYHSPIGSMNFVSKGVAKISESFIPVYIKEYNAGNRIKQVKLEIQRKEIDCPDGIEGCEVYHCIEVLKLRADGSVIIHTFKEKELKKHEVLSMLLKAHTYMESISFPTKADLIEWFDKTYPQ